MNPYTILAGLIAVVVLCAGSAYKGHEYGVDQQKATDQKEFDKINQEREAQKAEANTILQKQLNANIALAAERDKLKTDLEVQDAKNRKATLVLNANLATARLQFRTSQGTGNRANGASSLPSSGNTPSADGTNLVVLPDALTRDLRQLVFAADQLKDEYAKCYGFANKVK